MDVGIVENSHRTRGSHNVLRCSVKSFASASPVFLGRDCNVFMSVSICWTEAKTGRGCWIKSSMIFKCFPFSWEDNCLWRLPSIPFLCFSFFHSLNSLSLTHTLSLSPLLLCLASSSPGFHLFLSSTLPRLPTLSFCPSVALPPSLHPTPSFFPPSLSFSSFIYAILLPRFLCLHFSTSFSSSLPQLFPLQSLSPSFSFYLSFTSPNWSRPSS